MNGWYVTYIVNGKACWSHEFQHNWQMISAVRNRIAMLYGISVDDVKVEGVFYLNGTGIESQPMGCKAYAY